MNSRFPLVTVVTATYQSFQHIEDSIRSVFIQDYPSIEYIITDDGSDRFPIDKINDLIAKEKPERVACRIIQHKNNIGTVKNLNAAYKSGHGLYYINLSCGDKFFDKSVVGKIISRFKDNKSDVVVTSRIMYTGNYIPICLLPHYAERRIISGLSSGVDQYKALIKGRFYDMASGSAMSFSRKILESLGFFDEKYRLWEDGPFLAKYLQIGKLDCAYDIVSIWYESGGISASVKRKSTTPKGPLAIDTDLFNSSERMERLDLFSAGEKRLIRYNSYLYKYKDTVFQKLIMLLFPYEFFSSYRYIRQREQFAQSDENAIREILENKME